MVEYFYGLFMVEVTHLCTGRHDLFCFYSHKPLKESQKQYFPHEAQLKASSKRKPLSTSDYCFRVVVWRNTKYKFNTIGAANKYALVLTYLNSVNHENVLYVICFKFYFLSSWCSNNTVTCSSFTNANSWIPFKMSFIFQCSFPF